MTHDETDGSLSETASFKLSASLNARIEAALDGPLSKSEWIRQACEERLDASTEPAEPTLE